jgi:hypothetical protein
VAPAAALSLKGQNHDVAHLDRDLFRDPSHLHNNLGTQLYMAGPLVFLSAMAGRMAVRSRGIAMSESPTGRGYTQGSDSYRADDVAREERERRQLAMGRARRELVCTCRNSPFGMDVDRCPLHGIGCT